MNEQPERSARTPARLRTSTLIFVAALLGAAAGLAAVYGIGGLMRNAGNDPACSSAVEAAKRLAPLAGTHFP
jgi:hypothetical protein